MSGMTREDHAEAGRRLFEAERKREQIGLLSLQYPGMGLADAYAVQAQVVAARKTAGHKPVGWKIGLTSRAMQSTLGIDTPDSGILFDDMVFENGATVPEGRFIQPRIEAEIAFVMRAPIAGENVTRENVLAATESIKPALEILDTRILRADPQTGRARNVCDTIADNAANAGLVLGEEAFDPRDVDLRWMGAIVRRDGIVEETGLGAGVLDDPVEGIVWLARRLAQFSGRLEAGDIVLSGSFVRPIEVPPGSSIVADFGRYGEVRCAFA